MNFSFDKYNKLEPPKLILKRPDGEDVGFLKLAYELNFTLRYNDVSEISFKYPRYIDGVNETPYYSLIKAKKHIYIPDFECVFLLEKPKVCTDGNNEYVEVCGYTIENELNYKYINSFTGTYPLYDLISPSTSLLGIIIDNYVPSWSVGTIDPDLLTLSRTFDESSSTVYNFLTSTAETSYECVFTFDTVNKKINAVSVYNLDETIGINLTFENLLQTVEIEEQSDQLITCLSLYGDNDLSINGVNPLSTDKIYNFDYFLTNDWLSDEMIAKVNDWKTLYNTLQPTYANLLTELKTRKSELVVLNSELTDLEAELDALIDVKQVRMEQGISYSDINILINDKEDEIDDKENEIATKEAAIVSLNAQLAAINSQLILTNYFTADELITLDAITIESTYQTSDFTKTDSMTDVQVQEQEQALFDYGVRMLKRVSSPRYAFSVDSISFPFIKEFVQYSNNLRMGSYIRISTGDDYEIFPLLIEMNLNYEDESDFSLTFSTRTRSDDSLFYFSDIENSTAKSATTVSFDSSSWTQASTYTNNEVSTFINSSLNAANNAIISSNSEDILIDSHGIRCRKYNSSTSAFDPEQLWVSHNVLCFSDDNFDTTKLALGKITVDGASYYGLVADKLKANIIKHGKLQA